MQSSHSATRASNLTTALILVIAVLFAQWTGLHHDIKHAGLPSFQGSIVQVDIGNGEVSHSCIAFDAAALADSIPLTPYVAPMLIGARVLTLWTASASWDAAVTLYFSSRAPPLS